MASSAPPPYIRTLYDETHRSKHYMQPSIMSMANLSNLVGKLEHHTPTTDGSFSICIAHGSGVFISQALFESIPSEHRPALDTRNAGQAVGTIAAGGMISIGTTFFPLILTNHTTGEKFRIVLHAIVLPNLFMGMFIGFGSDSVVRSMQHSANGVLHGFELGERDEITYVQGI